MLCPRCGAAVAASDKFCAACGEIQTACFLNDESAGHGDGALLLRCFIGPHSSYYMSRFARFDERGRVGVSWHWPAFWCPFLWLIYRKLWIPALAYVVAYMVAGAMIMVAGWGGSTPAGFLLSLFANGLPALFANALYWRHCRRKIAQNAQRCDESREPLRELARQGGTLGKTTTFWAMPLAVLFFYAAILGFPVYIFVDAFGKMQRASAYGFQASEALGDYVRRHGAWPGDLEQAGFDSPRPDGVRDIEIRGRAGKLIFTLGGNALIRDKHLQWRLDRDRSGRLTWVCTSRDIFQSSLLPGCTSTGRAPQD